MAQLWVLANLRTGPPRCENTSARTYSYRYSSSHITTCFLYSYEEEEEEEEDAMEGDVPGDNEVNEESLII